MVVIKSVERRSPADKAGVKPGDKLIAISGEPIGDVLDYRFYSSSAKCVLTVCRDGETLAFNIKKGEYDDLGLEFETYLMDEKQSCRNKCIFCFIDQNPKGMRKDIYFKDDDSRLSFFFGNYITLTNLTDDDVARIIKMHISPVNVSVHTTDPVLRVKMMKNKHAGESLRYLDELTAHGVLVNAQIVLCRGVNDGAHLDKTLADLAAYYPNIGSVAVVPSGLTKYRDGLFPLEPFDKDSARTVIEQIDTARQKNLEKYGARLVQASDEWYLTAGLPLPDEDYYDGYPQLDNGVGSITSMDNEVKAEIASLVEDGFSLAASRTVSVVTGKAAYAFIDGACKALCEAFPGLTVHVTCAENRFFGDSITVAGLLTGSDMLYALDGKDLGETLFIPAVTLKHGENLFLDDMTLEDFEKKLGVPVVPVSADGREFVQALLGL